MADTRRKLWNRPALHTETGHRRVTWLELFYDLFFVVTVSQLAHGLLGEATFSKILSYCLLFVPVWWIWIGSTYYNERFETEGLENRLMFLLLTFPIVGLAVFIPNGMGEGSVGFALSYAAGRTVITGLWLRASILVPEFRPTGKIYTAGFAASVLIFVLSVFVKPPLRFALWGGALFIDMVTPWFTLKRQAKLPRFSVSKLPERYGLLMIIVLGESVVGVVRGLAEAREYGPAAVATAIIGVLLGFCLWWIYFDCVARRTARPSLLATILWSYLHLPLAMGIAATGAFVTNLMGSEHGSAAVTPSQTLACSVGVTLLVMGFLELTLRRDAEEPARPAASAALKCASGVLLVVLFPLFGALGPITTTSVLLGVELVHIVYGATIRFPA